MLYFTQLQAFSLFSMLSRIPAEVAIAWLPLEFHPVRAIIHVRQAPEFMRITRTNISNETKSPLYV